MAVDFGGVARWWDSLSEVEFAAFSRRFPFFGHGEVEASFASLRGVPFGCLPPEAVLALGICYQRLQAEPDG
jgi:hypothetical protein